MEHALPMGMLVGIGSYPGTDPEAAVARAYADFPQLISLPQLINRGPEERVGHALIALRGIDYSAELLRSFRMQTSAYGPFREALARGRFGESPAIKVALSGPATTVAMLEDSGAAMELSLLVEQLARVVVDDLRSAGAGAVHVWLDEPSWGQGRMSEEDYAAFVATLQATGALVGMHCCGAGPFAPLTRLGLDILSFDAAHYLTELLEGPPPDRDLRIAWGVIDTWKPFTTPDPAAIVSRWIAAIDAAYPEGWRGVYGRSYFTPACGLGTLSVEESMIVVEALNGVGRLLRERWESPPGPP